MQTLYSNKDEDEEKGHCECIARIRAGINELDAAGLPVITESDWQ